MCHRSILEGRRRSLRDCFHALLLSGARRCQAGHTRPGKRVSWEGGEEARARRVGGSMLVLGCAVGEGWQQTRGDAMLSLAGRWARSSQRRAWTTSHLCTTSHVCILGLGARTSCFSSVSSWLSSYSHVLSKHVSVPDGHQAAGTEWWIGTKSCFD